MSDRPVTEQRNARSARLDELPTRELVKLMNDEDALVAPAVGRELDAIARAIDAAVERMRGGGRLVHVGAGTSGRLGVLDAAECPPTFGTPHEQVVALIAGGDRAVTRAVEGAEDRRELALEDLARLALQAKDVLVGISASGRTPYVLAAIERAKVLGALTVGVSCTPDSPLATAAAIAITPVAGPEVVTGSTRLKAGTATKLVLNMLSTGAMVRLGRVRGNLMVDLMPTSAKLEQRAAAILAELAGVDETRARRLVADHGSVRAALRAHETRPSGSAAAAAAAHGASAATSGLVMGIDGGGSKTQALLARRTRDAGELPADVTIASPCNLSHDLEGAIRSIERAVATAFATARRGRTRLDALCVAAAGSGDHARREQLRGTLLEHGLAESVAIVHDAAPTLVAATRDGVGVALIAGTGSSCFGRDARGRCARSGGLGPFLGDEGSAFDLGRAALKQAARAADGRGAKLTLVRALIEALGVSEPRELASWAQDAMREPARIAALAPHVTAAAAADDPIALRIVERAASELALMAKTVVVKLGLPREHLPLVLAGGVLEHDDALRRRVVATLRSLGVTPDVQPAASAAIGALEFARQLADGKFDEASWFPA
jgi:N-acetylmuramic acid 6-phosphate etherase